MGRDFESNDGKIYLKKSHVFDPKFCDNCWKKLNKIKKRDRGWSYVKKNSLLFVYRKLLVNDSFIERLFCCVTRQWKSPHNMVIKGIAC